MADGTERLVEVDPVAGPQAVHVQLDQVGALVVAVEVVPHPVDRDQGVVAHHSLHSLSIVDTKNINMETFGTEIIGTQ